MRDVSTWVMKPMLRHIAAGTRGLTLPPTIVVGPRDREVALRSEAGGTPRPAGPDDRYRRRLCRVPDLQNRTGWGLGAGGDSGRNDGGHEGGEPDHGGGRDRQGRDGLQHEQRLNEYHDLAASDAGTGHRAAFRILLHRLPFDVSYSPTFGQISV